MATFSITVQYGDLTLKTTGAADSILDIPQKARVTLGRFLEAHIPVIPAEVPEVPIPQPPEPASNPVEVPAAKGKTTAPDPKPTPKKRGRPKGSKNKGG